MLNQLYQCGCAILFMIVISKSQIYSGVLFELLIICCFVIAVVVPQ